MGNMRSSKLTQILGGLAITIAGLFFCLATFLATIYSGQERVTVLGASASIQADGMGSPWLWAFVVAISVGLVEVGLWWVKRSLAMREAEIAFNDGGLWSGIARFQQFQDVLSAAFVGLVLLAGTAFASYVIYDLVAHNSVALGWQTYFVAILLVGYTVARRPLTAILGRVGGRIEGVARDQLPRYTLQENGLLIDLNWKRGWNRNETIQVQIGFGELEEVKRFSYLEAKTFAKYELGPRPDLSAKQTRDLYRLMKGEIERPSVYTVTGLNSAGKIVLLSGPELFYLVSFDTDSVDDLLTAFDAYRERHQG